MPCLDRVIEVRILVSAGPRQCHQTKLRLLADRIVAESNDLHRTDDPVHLAYQESNRRRGSMAGQLRLRVRYKNLVGPWFDNLLVSADEMT